MLIKNIKLLSLSLALLTGSVFASTAEPGEEIISQVMKLGITPAKYAPNSGKEREGPFKRLVIKNASVINGTGAPLQHMTIIIEGDRIVNLQGGGTGSLHTGEQDFDSDTKVIDATGKYVLPGFIDAHVHFGTPSHAFGGSLTDPEYVGKLMLSHGITTVRDAGSIMGLNWTLEHKKRSENGEISAPRIIAHAMFPESMKSPEAAREWVRAVRKKGADGIKLVGAAPKLIKAVIDEAKKLKMKTAYHHSQVSVTQTNVLDSARMGLDSMEHWYGLPEAMFEDRRIQHYPSGYNYNNEQDRFREAGNLWRQAAAPGSEKWQATINELISLDFTMDPTFTIYEANRDVTRSPISLPEPLNDPTLISKEVSGAIDKIYKQNVVYKKCGVGAVELVDSNNMQLDLLSPDPNNQILTNTLDSINSRFGKDTVKIGSQGVDKTWEMKREFLSPAYTTRWKDIPKIKC